MRVYRNTPDAPPAYIIFQLIGCLALSMITRIIVTPDDWESLRTDQWELQGLGYCRRHTPTSALFIPLMLFPQLPEIFSQTPLPPGIPVMLLPMLRYFPYLGHLPHLSLPTLG